MPLNPHQHENNLHLQANLLPRFIYTFLGLRPCPQKDTLDPTDADAITAYFTVGGKKVP